MDDGMKTKEELLSWRPQKAGDEIPRDVFDARMSLLSAEDAEKLKSDFESGRDPVAMFLYFGGDMFGSLGANSSSVMTRCAYVGVDKETTLRLFKASAYGPLTDEKFVPDLLEEAMEFVGEFREEMSIIGKKSAPHVKPRYLTHTKDYGNYR